MSGDSLMFDEFIALCDEQYEYGLIEFKNGDITNGPGENDGSAKGRRYFECPANYGGFVRPGMLATGDFPPFDEEFGFGSEDEL